MSAVRRMAGEGNPGGRCHDHFYFPGLGEIHSAREPGEGDAGLREAVVGKAGFSPDLGAARLGAPLPVQRGNCPDGAEPGVWSLAVWAQHPLPPPPPASLLHSAISPARAGLLLRPVLPASHGLEAISSSPVSALPCLCQPLKGFPWSSFCPQDWSEFFNRLLSPKPHLGKGGRGRGAGHGSRGSVGPCRVWILF